MIASATPSTLPANMAPNRRRYSACFRRPWNFRNREMTYIFFSILWRTSAHRIRRLSLDLGVQGRVWRGSVVAPGRRARERSRPLARVTASIAVGIAGNPVCGAAVGLAIRVRAVRRVRRVAVRRDCADEVAAAALVVGEGGIAPVAFVGGSTPEANGSEEGEDREGREFHAQKG